MKTAAENRKKLGIYVHIPFCAGGKCPYCDFYSVVGQDSKFSEYTDAVLKDMKRQSNKAAERTVDTVYFGGGTPSLLGKDLGKLLDGIKENYTLEENAEITFEANPGTVDYETLLFLNKAGFNRISFGMQSAVPEELKILGRRHTKEDVKTAVDQARAAGFLNLSLDLMLCVPLQTKETMLSSIDYAASLSPEHISAYLLKIENSTPFYKIKNTLNLPDDDTQADRYLEACQALEKRGYYQYEISNFSKKGFESRHNLRYWNCDEYLGFGPSAHSFFEGTRRYYPRALDGYLNGQSELFESDGGNLEEYIMLRLRLTDGISQKDMLARFNTDFSRFNAKTLGKFKESGLIIIKNGRLSLTKKGFLVSNSVIGELIFN